MENREEVDERNKNGADEFSGTYHMEAKLLDELRTDEGHD